MVLMAQDDNLNSNAFLAGERLMLTEPRPTCPHIMDIFDDGPRRTAMPNSGAWRGYYFFEGGFEPAVGSVNAACN